MVNNLKFSNSSQLAAISWKDSYFLTLSFRQMNLWEEIDIGIPVSVAKFLLPIGCDEIHLVSSVGAKANAKNFYLKIKGTVVVI